MPLAAGEKMRPMNLLIVDDEPAARAELLKLCENARNTRVVGQAATGARAIEAVEALRPDLTLLDTDLPDMSGFEVLRALRRSYRQRTILVTASANDAPDVFAAGALDFLVKPVSEAAFTASIMRARQRPSDTAGGPRTIGPRAEPAGRPLLLVGEREHRLYPLDPLDIDYIEAEGNYVTYYLASVPYIARDSIKRLDPVLAPVGFMRIERSLLLNVRAIAYAQPLGHGSFEFTLTAGARLRSSSAYRDTILAVLPLRRRAPSSLSA
jgi:two-component system LytT family response regulator